MLELSVISKTSSAESMNRERESLNLGRNEKSLLFEQIQHFHTQHPMCPLIEKSCISFVMFALSTSKVHVKNEFLFIRDACTEIFPHNYVP